MKAGSIRGRGGGTVVTIVSVAVVVLSATIAAPVAAQSPGPDECGPTMPTSEVREGMAGIGYTVSKGTSPEQFTVDVVGVMPDGIGPGRDMIVVEASSPAITRAGGIWYGMSGSPIYVDGRLIGALAYGLAWGPSTVAGLTPADDLLKLLNRPAQADEAGSDEVALTPRMVEAIARATASAPSDMSTTMSRLRSPLSVSGVGARGMREVTKAIRREELPLIPYAGSSTSTAAPTAERPVRGGNFAAALSYGDISLSGIGTTSYVCEGRVVAFGHPFSWFPEGRTALGANAADALTVVNDPTFGAYKLANVGGSFGTLDQDRFAGVRALLGSSPQSIPITSSVRTTEGDERDGRTDALRQQYVPFLALIHTLSNIDFTFDKIGEGSAALTWTVTGKRADGSAWSLSRENLFSSQYDIAYESLNEMADFLYTLFFNGFEEITFDSIDVDTVTDERQRYHSISRVLVAKNGGEFRQRSRLRAKPGTLLTARVFLQPLKSLEEQSFDLQVQIPSSARRPMRFELRGGSRFGYYDYYCFSEYDDCDGDMGPKIESFDDLLASLTSRARNHDLLAELKGGGGRVKASDLRTTDQVVMGSKTIEVELRLPRRR